MLAAGSGDVELVKVLIELGANIHETCVFKLTALHHAAGHNKVEVAKELIKVLEEEGAYKFFFFFFSFYLKRINFKIYF